MEHDVVFNGAPEYYVDLYLNYHFAWSSVPLVVHPPCVLELVCDFSQELSHDCMPGIQLSSRCVQRSTWKFQPRISLIMRADQCTHGPVS